MSEVLTPERGDVVVARKRVGFGAGGDEERFIVVQDDTLGLPSALGTVIVVPLAEWTSADAADPLVVRVPKREAGTRADVAAWVSLVGAVRIERFGSLPMGRASGGTVSMIEDRLRLLLALS